MVLEGITIDQKPLKEHLEIIGHRDAFKCVESLVSEKQEFSEHIIKRIHSLWLEEIIMSKRVSFLLTMCSALVCAVGIFFISNAYVLSSLDNIITDPLYQHKSSPNSNISIIGIDEKTLNELGEFSDWSRSGLAALIRMLNSDPKSKPAVIALDVMFFGESDPQSDMELVNAAEEGGNVVISTQAIFSKALQTDEQGHTYFDNTYIETIEEPFAALKNVTRQGHINTRADDDSIVRRSIHKLTKDGNAVYSFGYEVAKLYAENLNLDIPTHPDSDPSDPLGLWYIPFSSAPKTYIECSVSDILLGRVPTSRYKDDILIIGAYADSMRDFFNTSISRGYPMHGCEIHANIVDAILDENYKIPASKQTQAIYFAVFTFLVIMLLCRIGIKGAAIVLIMAVVIVISTALVLYSYGTVISVVYPLIVSILAVGVRISIVGMSERRTRRRVTDTFRKYVAPQVVDDIIKRGDYANVLGGARRDIAVLFADIRGFTSMSENMESENVVEILNDCLKITTDAVFNNGGTLDKFIGDATMAIFNAPFDQADYEFAAISAAMEMSQKIKDSTPEILKKYGVSVAIGVGVNVGPSVVGNIGTSFRLDYTAIGDTVNTAARLESNALAGQVLISETLYSRVKDRIRVTPLGEIPLKGKSKNVSVFVVEEILG